MKEENEAQFVSVKGALDELRKGLEEAKLFLGDTRVCPQEVRDVPEETTKEALPKILAELKSFILTVRTKGRIFAA